MKAKLLIPALALAVLGLGVFGVTAVQAQDEEKTYPPLVDQLVDQFGLNREEVRSFFDGVRNEHQVRREERRQESLDQAVVDGVITQEQREALEAKRAELQAERQQHREEMQAWFEGQGIDPAALRSYMRFGLGGHGPGFDR